MCLSMYTYSGFSIMDADHIKIKNKLKNKKHKF